MRVELKVPDSAKDPRLWVQHQQVLAMVLRPGSVEWGVRRSEMERVDYLVGDLGLCRPHEGEGVGMMDVPSLNLGISDAALVAIHDEFIREVELRPKRKFVDARLRALVEAVNAERAAGFPSGRLVLDFVEQALAVALVNGHAVMRRSAQMYRGALGAGRLRRITELVHARREYDLSLDEMAQAVELSTAHFGRMFRKSTGETPHQFVLSQRIQRAKEMLRGPNTRVLDVAVACGFKTQAHFARVFRQMCAASPKEYRYGRFWRGRACVGHRRKTVQLVRIT